MSYNKRLTTFLNRHSNAWWSDSYIWGVLSLLALLFGLIAFFAKYNHGC